MTFVDTNYFLRFLLADISSQHQLAKTLFQQAAGGKVSLFTSAVVIFEIYWVLLSVYSKNKDQITATLDPLLDMSFIDFEHHSLLKQAISLYTHSSLGLVDAFNFHYAQSLGARDFKTFDTTLSRRFQTTYNVK